MGKKNKTKSKKKQLDPVVEAMMHHFSPPSGQGSGEVVFDWRMLILLVPLLPYIFVCLQSHFVYWLLLVYSILIVILHLCFVSRLKQAMANILNPVSFVRIVMLNFVLIVVHYGFLFAFLQKVDSGQFKIESSDSLFIDMIYYSVVTIATVGYGDIVPSSYVSKLFAICEIFVGIWFLIMMIPISVADQVERIRHFRETKGQMMDAIRQGIEDGRLKPVAKDENLPASKSSEV